MYCPTHNWQRVNTYAWKRAWGRMRRALPYLESMACGAWLAPVMGPPNSVEEAAGPGVEEAADRGPAGGPPPAHPERLATDRPPTRAERELWAGLNLDIE